jgi:tetratricopeptide (TPR) repeat protein
VDRYKPDGCDTCAVTPAEDAGSWDHGRRRIRFPLASLAYARLGRFDRALKAYQQARRLDPHDPSRYVDVSAILCNLGRWEDAAVALLEALAIRPDDPAVMGRLVEVYHRLDPDGSEVAREGSSRLRLDGNHPVVRRDRCAAYRELVEIYTQAGEPEAAAETRRQGGTTCALTAP